MTPRSATKLVPRVNWLSFGFSVSIDSRVTTKVVPQASATKLIFNVSLQKQSDEFLFHQEAFRFQKNERKPQVKSFYSSERKQVQKKQNRANFQLKDRLRYRKAVSVVLSRKLKWDLLNP